VAFAEVNSKAMAARVFKVDKKCVQTWVKQKENFERMDAKKLKRKGQKVQEERQQTQITRMSCTTGYVA